MADGAAMIHTCLPGVVCCSACGIGMTQIAVLADFGEEAEDGSWTMMLCWQCEGGGKCSPSAGTRLKETERHLRLSAVRRACRRPCP